MTYTMSLPQGSMLEHYRIERVLGQGIFGITYLAYDTQEERQVAIREHFPNNYVFRGADRMQVLPQEDSEDIGWMQENFLEEAQMLQTLDQAQLVKLHRTFTANGTAYYVMDYIEGVPLSEASELRHSSHQWTEEELRSLLDSLLGALEYLHAKGALHGDIKPENILVNARLEPTIIDFGMARRAYTDQTEHVIESIGYTPIEQLKSQSEVGAWSDLYALGCTMYTLVTGERPARSIDRIQVAQDPVKPLLGREELSHYTLILRESIDHAMAVDAGKRWQSAREWRVVVQGGYLNPTGPQYIYKTSRLTWLGLGISTLALLGLGGVLIYHGQEMDRYEGLLAAHRQQVEHAKDVMAYMVEDNLDEERIRMAPARTDLYVCLSEAMQADRDKDYPRAFRLYRQAAAQGDPDAQNNLGSLYEQTVGENPPYALALKWYTRAAMRGSGYAMKNLGSCYELGKGVPVDTAQARAWYLKCLETLDPRYEKARKLAEQGLKRIDQGAL